MQKATLIGVLPVLPAAPAAAADSVVLGRVTDPDGRPVARAAVAWLLMEAQARYLYPRRLKTERLVMFYRDDLADPQGDAEAMDRHAARLVAATRNFLISQEVAPFRSDAF